MAGVAAVPTGGKVGTHFLASSHFRIGQDNSVTQDCLKSVFKKDYVPWGFDGKPPGSQPPRPAEIFQKDDRYFNEKLSETAKAYEYIYQAKPDQHAAQGKLNATNFKMDRDLSKFDSFHTTHRLHYTPKQNEQFVQHKARGPPRSFIPQGDPDKAPNPVSDYKDRFRGHNVADIPMVKAESQHLKAGPPTIQGDRRQHEFSTTHAQTYQGVLLPRVQPFKAPVGCNIPQGDQNKEVTMETVQQASFPAHKIAPVGKYDKNAVMSKLQGTNIKQDDGHDTWNNYMTTMKQSYLPKHGLVERSAPDCQRNHSDFPTGDDDPYRNAYRANMTTNRFYHSDPPPTHKPDIVSGAMRTASNVCFGEPTQAKDFYETTTDSTYRPVSIPYNYKRGDPRTKGGIPLDYYPDELHNTTHQSDFINPQQGKTLPNPIAIENLKKSHILAPLRGHREFTTEHLDQYTPKITDLQRVADPGKLQRSTVPLGTLQENMTA